MSPLCSRYISCITAAPHDPLVKRLHLVSFVAAKWFGKTSNDQVHELGRLLQACGDEGNLCKGKLLHAKVVKDRLEGNEFLAKHIMHMYIKCDSISDAREVFLNMRPYNVILWTGLITAYARKGEFDESLLLFRRMQLDGIMPNKITLISVLQACVRLKDGTSIHELITKSDFEWDVTVATALVGMYCRCGSLGVALHIFDLMPNRNVVSWSVIMSGCKQQNQPMQAVKHFRRMQQEGVAADNITFVTLLDVCSSCPAAEIPDEMILKFDVQIGSNVIVGTALVNMYGKHGMLYEARETFSRMRYKNVVSWTVLICSYCEHELFDDAMKVFQQMQLEGISPTAVVFINVLNACAGPEHLLAGRRVKQIVLECGLETDVILGNAIVNMYGKCGVVGEARQHFDKLVDAGNNRDVVLWNGMFAAYALDGQCMQALELFTTMQLEGVKPNKATYASILLQSRRALKTSPHHLRLIRLCVSESGFEEVIAGISTLDASVNLDNGVLRGVVWWTTLIVESMEQGCYEECLEHFGRMQLEGVRPNEVTISNVLYAHDLRRGRLLHQLILDSELDIEVGVGTALIHLYARSQLPEEGNKVFLSMQEHNTISWTAMIQCYEHSRENLQALQLYRQMHLEGLRPDENTFTSVLLACSSFAALSEVRSVHDRVRESGFFLNHLVNTTLLSVYGKCGTLQEALCMFQRSNPLQISSWSSMIATASRHGCSREAITIFGRMQQEGARADDIAMLCVLAACNHGGMTGKGLEYFISMLHDYEVDRRAEHCATMADMLGRAGRLEDAEELIRKMPFEAPASMWMTLLGASRTQGDLEQAKKASARVTGINPQHAQSYVLLSNIYAEGTRQDC